MEVEQLIQGTEVRILLADGHSLFRDALSTALAVEPDLTVVGEAKDGLEAVAEAARTEPQVAVLDADLPNGDGVRAARLIRDRLPECRILILAAEEDPEVLTSAVEVGASGYLTKASPLTDLVVAIRSVHRGDTLVPARMLGSLLEQLIRRRQEHDEAVRRLSRLTTREREVLTLLARGGDNDSIAQVLVISPQTARTHIQNVLVKLGVHSRLEAAALAIHNGLLSEPAEAEGEMAGSDVSGS
ncbi:MAG TPA: response regulator transcription factor [Actinomycetota bacterium]|jgi:DNA-binding NarL/FixJ family response regulator|nr:response regulator transcription factor [Actinomycetota bacterium]